MHGEGSDTSAADQVVEEIERAGGVAAASYESVTSPEGGEAIVRTAVDRFGRLDAVVSNAGSSTPWISNNWAPADWRRLIGVHLDGSFHLSQTAFRAMKSQGYGRFVFIASSAGLFGQLDKAHYAAAKAGHRRAPSNVIAIEGAAHGILANSVLPFGLTRMVTEYGWRGAGRRSCHLTRHRTRTRGSHRRLPRQPGLRVHPSQLLGRRGSLCPRLRRARKGLARRARQPADGR